MVTFSFRKTPLGIIDDNPFFEGSTMIDFKELLKSGVHFGHKTSFGHPKMRRYIWGAKNRIHLIDVSKTAVLLDRAGKKLKELAGNGGSILWVGTKKAARPIIEKAGKDLDMPFVVNRWIGGTLKLVNSTARGPNSLDEDLRRMLVKPILSAAVR